MYVKLKVDKIEHAEVCRKCGGWCCRKTPCAYLPSDFGEVPTLEALAEKVEIGRATLLRLEGYEKRILTSKTLGRPGLDIIEYDEWYENRGRMEWLRICAFLTKTGCSLELGERPSGGAMFVPQYVHGVRACYMPVGVTALWVPYQPLLKELEDYIVQKYPD